MIGRFCSEVLLPVVNDILLDQPFVGILLEGSLELVKRIRKAILKTMLFSSFNKIKFVLVVGYCKNRNRNLMLSTI